MSFPQWGSVLSDGLDVVVEALVEGVAGHGGGVAQDEEFHAGAGPEVCRAVAPVACGRCRVHRPLHLQFRPFVPFVRSVRSVCACVASSKDTETAKLLGLLAWARKKSNK